MTQKTNISETEINKTLAEFMGLTYFDDGIFEAEAFAYDDYICEHYTKSLDACLPVVEKAGFKFAKRLEIYFTSENLWRAVSWKHNGLGLEEFETINKSPSLALATALYHVIKRGEL